MRLVRFIAVIGGLLLGVNALLADPIAPIDLNKPTPNSVPSSSGEGFVADWLNGLIDIYNEANNANLPKPAVQAFKVNLPEDGPGVTAITLPLGEYQYLVLHWGGQGQNGSNGKGPKGATTIVPEVPYDAFYIGGYTGDFTFDYNAKNGLSWYAMYNPIEHNVPDGGLTAMLLGLGLSGLGASRRFLKK